MRESVTVTLMRHSESECNARHQLPERGTGSPLTPKGKSRTTTLIQEVGRPDRLYSSPACRAIETAQAFNLTPRVLQELRELDLGTLAGRSEQQAWDAHTRVISAWAAGFPKERFPGGESWLELLQRIETALGKIYQEARRQDTISAPLAVTHAGVIKAAIKHFANQSASHVDHCGWISLNKTHNSWVLNEGGGIHYN